MRLSHGKYYHRDNQEGSPTRHARAVFLEQVSILAPQVLEDLLAILPLYVAAHPHLSAVWDALLAEEEPVESIDHDGVPVLEEPEIDPPEVYKIVLSPDEPCPLLSTAWADIRPLRVALVAWAERAHLLAPWVFEAAFETLESWRSHGVSRPLSWRYWFVNLRLGRREFCFSHPGWWVEQRRRSQAADDIRSAFEDALSAYLDRVEEVVEAGGWVQTPRKQEDHFERLVHYQVNGWSHARIGRHYHVARRTVGDGLEDTARLIGLSLRRRGRGGRPRKAADI